MKIAAFFLVSLFPLFLSGQTASVTTGIDRQVDSMIQASRAFASEFLIEQALEAIAAAEKLVLSPELGIGRESAVYGKVCYQYAKIFDRARDYPEAEKWAITARDIQAKTEGTGQATYANTLQLLGSIYSGAGKYKEAESTLLESKALLEKIFGKENPEYAGILISLGNLYIDANRYEDAEQTFLQALTVLEKTQDFPAYAGCLYNLATVFLRMSNFEKAQSLLLEVKTYCENKAGVEHPAYVPVHINLGVLYLNLGQYEKAELLLQHALEIQERTSGKMNPMYGDILNFLAITYTNMGNYEASEPLFLEVKAIWGQLFGKEHLKYASILHNLSGLYAEMGNFQQAEQLLLESKQIYVQTLGDEHPELASALHNLAALQADLGDFKNAELSFLDALAYWEKAAGKETIDYARSLLGLAEVYRHTGNFAQAESMLMDELALLEKMLGKSNPDYARAVNSLADLYSHTGQYEKAGPLFVEARRILQDVLGKEHPDYATGMKALAFYDIKIKNWAAAAEALEELAAAHQNGARQALRHLSEREIQQFLMRCNEAQAYINTFAQIARLENRADTRIAGICYDNVLFFKGLLLNASNNVRRHLAGHPDAVEKFDALKSCGRQLAAEYAKPVEERRGVAELEETANNLEKDLARTIASFGNALRQVKWQEVRQRLKPGEAAIEFVDYRNTDHPDTIEHNYAALVLLSDSEQPIFVPLFEEKALEDRLKTSSARKSDYVNNLYNYQKKASPGGAGQKTLYELVWQPLEEVFSQAPTPVKTIYFSPSGLLHRLNLGAIPGSQQENLADRYHFVALGSTRALVTGHTAPLPAGPGGTGEALLFGGVRYELDSVAVNASSGDAWTTTRGGVTFEKTDSTNRGGTWAFLPWTEKEVNSIAPILKTAGLKTSTRTGSSATEDFFKTAGRSGTGNTASPRILHIATHGYFFPDPKTAAGQLWAADGRAPVFKMSEHPMIRSGLVLAGGNFAWKTGKSFKTGMEDGILTAYEISQMDLSNTELVVLSACETGLGEIQGNEGVYGLQRAFKIAGAKFLIMSLWQVPDFQTQELMTVFYRKWLTEKMSIPNAFSAAQRAMRAKYEHPYFWAGFVLVE